ncbi:PRMT5 arginine-N-methyltransferase-domain-containing protein [Dipodascopsis tothii]|uniref:PRMT5 arginine-N-methyltransferase-domain-containing protein n=1 Tax=Dipodascopsis tothii TaxID=44089 RepID=UPI0034CD86BF
MRASSEPHEARSRPRHRRMADRPYFVGLQLAPRPKTVQLDAPLLKSHLDDGYDVLAVPVTNAAFRSRVRRVSPVAETPRTEPAPWVPAPTIAPPVLDEVSFEPETGAGQALFGTTARWIELDSPDPVVADISLQVLKHEVAYAVFCGLSYVVVQGPKRRTNVSQFAQALNEILLAYGQVHVCVHLPMTEADEPAAGHRRSVATDSGSDEPEFVPGFDYLSIWDVWHTIRTLCDYNGRLAVALQVPAKLPPQDVVSRWFAEPLSMLLVSARVFLTNPKGYPVLPKAHQFLLFKYLKTRPYVVLQDVAEAVQTLAGPAAKDDKAHLIYMRHLASVMPTPSAVELFGQGYQDFLQSPLQPLVDNLESGTYEVFEQDPVKYSQYELAIHAAVVDYGRSEIVIAVVGAGRGPIVACALRAAERAGVRVHVYAVEKNQSAFAYLQRRHRLEWSDAVELVYSDMRAWQPPRQADIMVSELLGSFGDNELSPECLDGAQHALKAGGIMIPQSYSPHFIPAMSPKLYSALKFHGKDEAWGTPYVVLLEKVDLLGAKIERAWVFDHPNPHLDTAEYAVAAAASPLSNRHNCRHTKATFAAGRRGVMHGFAGYFEAVLYKAVELSTRPDTIAQKSRNMVSWFPIWFPLAAPLYVPDGAEIDVSIWRRTDDRKVWYEWAAEVFLRPDRGSPAASPAPHGAAAPRVRLGASKLHNVGGKCSSMSL